MLNKLETVAINKWILTPKILEDLPQAIAKCESCKTLDLRNNNIPDEYGGWIVRIMQAATERRDNIIWAYGLRNEYPNHIDKVGLKSIILRRNKLGKNFIDSLWRWVKYDDYMRHIDLWYNKIGSDPLKKFVSKLQHNKSLVSLEFRGNSGYSEIVQKHAVILLLKNLDQLKSQKVNIQPQWLKKDIFDISISDSVYQKQVDDSEIINNSINIKTGNNKGLFDNIEVSLPGSSFKTSTTKFSKRYKSTRKFDDGKSSTKVSTISSVNNGRRKRTAQNAKKYRASSIHYKAAAP